MDYRPFSPARYSFRRHRRGRYLNTLGWCVLLVTAALLAGAALGIAF
jgi:hypothetical protein